MTRPASALSASVGDHLPEFDEIEAHDPEGHGPSLVPSLWAWRVGLVAAVVAAAAGGVIAWTIGGAGLGVLAVVVMLAVGVPMAFLIRIRATSYLRMARQAAREHTANARRATDVLATSRQDDDGGPPPR